MNEACYYRVSVKGIVIDDQDRVLLARESDGTWDMLGGGLDHGEDPIACLKREVQEETDLTVTKVWPEPKYFVTAHKASSNVYIANIIYQIELKSLDFTASDECQELRFFSLQEMSNLQLPPNMQRLVETLTQHVEAKWPGE
ncbi:MAG: NUDIX hydrolase [Candidatus Saccharibacteria bacterium]